MKNLATVKDVVDHIDHVFRLSGLIMWVSERISTEGEELKDAGLLQK